MKYYKFCIWVKKQSDLCIIVLLASSPVFIAEISGLKTQIYDIWHMADLIFFNERLKKLIAHFDERFRCECASVGDGKSGACIPK